MDTGSANSKSTNAALVAKGKDIPCSQTTNAAPAAKAARGAPSAHSVVAYLVVHGVRISCDKGFGTGAGAKGPQLPGGARHSTCLAYPLLATSVGCVARALRLGQGARVCGRAKRESGPEKWDCGEMLLVAVVVAATVARKQATAGGYRESSILLA